MSVIIVGAGPAGLMASGAFAQSDVTILERNEKAGKKLYITGKGRCNVTHECDAREFLNGVVNGGKFLMSALNNFTPADTVALLESLGTTVKTERGGRIFPQSDKASDVTKALVKYALSFGAKISYGVFVKNVYRQADKFCLETQEGEKMECDKLILACGGMSYSVTGSDGNGFRLAKMLGHSVTPPAPALVPILLQENVSSLQGVSLKNVTATVTDGKTSFSQFGEMLFTEKGVSGPIILSLSSLINREDVSKFRLLIDLKPALTPEVLDRRILSDFEKVKNKQIKNALGDLLPKAMIPQVIKFAEIDENAYVHDFSKVNRQRLVNALKGLAFHVCALEAVERGIVTSGGVNLNELSPKTMESKLIKGLYFAGEMIHADAFTGGYNIQIALSTGYAAGKGAKEWQ